MEDEEGSCVTLCVSVCVHGTDEALVPWQTAVFGFFRENSTVLVGDITDEPAYRDDTFGLRSAVAGGRVSMTVVPHIAHHQWYRDAAVVRQHLLPVLSLVPATATA